jgi:hypothetical protein
MIRVSVAVRVLATRAAAVTPKRNQKVMEAMGDNPQNDWCGPDAALVANNRTFMHELNDGEGAAVDTRLVPLLKFLNRLSVVTTSSSFDGSFYTITVTGDYQHMSELLFNHLRAMSEHIKDVRLEIMWYSGRELVGLIAIPAASLDDFSKRVGGWLEMLHK